MISAKQSRKPWICWSISKLTTPYATATSGEKALDEIQKILGGFGCNKFGNFTDSDKGTVAVQFVYRERTVQVEASAKGWAAIYLRENPWSSQRRTTQVEYEKRAVEQGSIAVYSMLRDWIKGQITAIESGILTFEGAFLGQILLSNGKTVLEHAMSNKLLGGPSEKES